MEALITKSNAERIIKQMDKSEFDILDFKNDMKFKWFNKGELKQLKAFSMLFSKPDEFFSKYVPLSRNDGKTYCLDSGQSNAVEYSSKIRRLTPIECERLQTVKDNYTNFVSDSQRYKMLGNGWTIDVITHILNYII